MPFPAGQQLKLPWPRFLGKMRGRCWSPLNLPSPRDQDKALYEPLKAFLEILFLPLTPVCLQVKYKESIGKGTPIPDLPEVKRVKETQKHISSVIPCPCSLQGSAPAFSSWESSSPPKSLPGNWNIWVLQELEMSVSFTGIIPVSHCLRSFCGLC